MAFSITLTTPMKEAERVSRSLGVLAGKISITSYSQTLVECTALTKYFRPTSNGTAGGFKDGLVSVQIDGPSSGGYVVSWDHGTGAFKCWAPTAIVCNSAVGAGAALLMESGGGTALHATSAVGTLVLPGTEAAANTLIGTFGFFAIGFIP